MGGLRGSPVPGFRDRYFGHFPFREARDRKQYRRIFSLAALPGVPSVRRKFRNADGGGF